MGCVCRLPVPIAALAVVMIAPAVAEARPRARDLGVPFSGTPGPANAITDVAGVEVGHTTLISGSGKLEVGTGPVRTGVTAILPRGRASLLPVFASWFSLNGNGEMTGTTWVDESGILEGPILLTNTLAVGVVRDAAARWVHQHVDKRLDPDYGALPVVAETWDGDLSDIYGKHIQEKHVIAALEGARGGPVAEGNVGGGTGMTAYEFKGGIGTASRRLSKPGGYTVGVLVQANMGRRPELTVAGVPVGRELPIREKRANEKNSIIIVVATDAPLLPHQLKRIARRAGLGLARTGAVARNSSGDIFVAFSTANRVEGQAALSTLKMVPNGQLDPLFSATVEATEEAIVNALCAAETMTGVGESTIEALPHRELEAALKKYNRLKGKSRR
jgi:L-aminopeptidase/D-esterase-like protein